MPVAKDATMDVVAISPIHHGTREEPKVAYFPEKVTLPRDEALQLIAAGHAAKPADVPKDAKPEDIAEVETKP